MSAAREPARASGATRAGQAWAIALCLLVLGLLAWGLA